jgi:hypothetical protein
MIAGQKLCNIQPHRLFSLPKLPVCKRFLCLKIIVFFYQAGVHILIVTRKKYETNP